MYRLILVPLDGSPFAEQALPLAMSIARRAGAPIELVSVARFSSLSAGTTMDIWARGWRAYLEKTAERMARFSAVTVIPGFLEEESDDIAPRIAAHAANIRADLIVMASHGRGAFGRFWIGSVPYELMHIAAPPLLLVNPAEQFDDWERDAVLKRVLIPLDGSSFAARMIEPAVALGSLMDADYDLLRVIRTIPLGTPEFDSISLSSLAVETLGEIRSVQERVRKEARDYLDGIGEPLRARGLRVRTQVREGNDPGIAILDVAEDPNIDMIALEAHGRRGLSSLILGSVARKVFHGTSKLILVQTGATTRHGGD